MDDAQAVLGRAGDHRWPRCGRRTFIRRHTGQPSRCRAGNVSRIVYLASFQLDVGESLLGFYGAPVSPERGDFEAVPDDPIALFYGDVPRSEAEEAAERLVPQSARSFSDVLTEAGWHTVPSTYIVCEDDQAFPAQSQQLLAARSGAVHRVESSHSPFMSKPEELAALLAKIALESDA